MPGELFFEIHRPGEPRLERRALLRDVVSVQGVAHLQAQRVARGQAARLEAERRPALDQLAPECRGDPLGREELAAALAGVAAARDSHPHVAVGALGALHIGECLGHREEGFHQLQPERALDGDRREVGAVGYHHVLRGILLEDGQDRGRVRSVGDDQPAVLGHAVGDQVVDDAALLVKDQVVLLAADRQLREVVREASLEPGQSPRALHVHLAQVGEVEHPHGLAHGPVLGEGPRVLDGHGPARELPHLGAEGHVLVLEGCPGQSRVHRASFSAILWAEVPGELPSRSAPGAYPNRS